MARETVWISFFDMGKSSSAATLYRITSRGSTPKRFSRAQLQTLLSALRALSSVRDADVTSSGDVTIKPHRGKDELFQREVTITARMQFPNVKTQHSESKPEVAAVKRKVHIVYITDPRLSQAVIVVPGKITLGTYEVFKLFEKLGKVEACKEPFRLHITVGRIDRNFERQFMDMVLDHFSVVKTHRCRDAIEANEHVIPRIR